MSPSEYAAVAAVLFSFSLGSFIGHAIGYGKGRRSRAPRYHRVGTPE